MTREPPFGFWESPLQPADLAHTKGFRDVAWDRDGSTLVWLEARGDRGVLVCQHPQQAPRDLTETLSVRAKVGYGGGDFTVADGAAFFVEADGRIFRQDLETGPAVPITPAFGNAASPCVSRNGQWMIYVHSDRGVDRLAIVDTRGNYWPQHLQEGADFYMQPAWHPDGHTIAWIEWNHPNMPWDGARLMLGSLHCPEHQLPLLRSSQHLAGDEDTTVFQAEFSPDGRFLVYTCDQRGWSNLWRFDLARQESDCLTEDEYDVALPAWGQGMRVFAFGADGRQLYFSRSEPGSRRLCSLDLDTRFLLPVPELASYSCVEQIATAPKGGGVACIASDARISSRVVSISGPDDQGRVHARSTDKSVPAHALALPEPLTFSTDAIDALRGLYFKPTNPRFEGKGLPPTIVMIHGGPTGQADVGYNPKIQFFATRGYAVFDLDYRGSSGYGRSYQQSLSGHWGVTDMEDALAAGRYLSESGRGDPDRLILMGSSAGGYTVLRTLTMHPGFFKAGICVYGISNLFSLAADTHKFEAHYLDRLVGPLPEASEVYRDRSPIFAADQLHDPVAIFHGSQDKVVPLDQAESIVTSLRDRGVPHEYHVFEGEGHGWRKPETVDAFYAALEGFLRRTVLSA